MIRGKFLILFLFILLFSFFFSSCHNPWMKDVWGLKVIQFDANGGSPTPPKQQVLRFELIQKPANPAKANYHFAGWYVDNGTFQIPWDFNKIPAIELTLYARWVSETIAIKQVAASSGHTVAIKTNGELWVWGWNDSGQLGLGDTIDRFIPEQVIFP